jgi:hypothetical protein
MIKILSIGSLAVLAAFGLGARVAHANIIDLTNTGVNFSAGTLVDNAWSLVGGSNSLGLSYPAPAYTNTTNGTFPVGPWVLNNPGVSQWDTPTNPLSTALDPSKDGTYTYQTAFTSTGTTGFFTGQFAADNAIASITVNGVTIYTGPGAPNNQFDHWTSFSYAGLLKNGQNLIDFNLVNYGQNGGNPSGLNVEFLTSGVPEVSTWAMMVMGFAGVGLLAYRRRRGPSFRLA